MLVRSRSRLVFVALLAGSAVPFGSGCGAEAPPEEGEPVGEVAEAITVEQAVSSGCSTIAVIGLAKQIVAETNCIIPNAYASVPDLPNLTKSATTFAFLQTPARDAFVATLKAHPGTQMTVNSMLRTVAQQYLLYAWYKAGQCGISLAATPGTSNHETGTAFDTDDHAAWQSALAAHDWQWFGSSDVVHFDYVGAGTVDLKGKDVLAFQRLWNLNNPNDQISEDGQYGPQTEARLQKSPAGGFAKGSTCSAPTGGGGTSGSGGTSGGTAGSSGKASGGAGQTGSGGSTGTSGSGGTTGTSGSGGGSGKTGTGGSGVAGSMTGTSGHAGASGSGGTSGSGGETTGSSAGAPGAGGSVGNGGGGGSAEPQQITVGGDDAGSSGGCGCHLSSRDDPRGAVVAALLAVGALLRRRERRGCAED